MKTRKPPEDYAARHQSNPSKPQGKPVQRYIYYDPSGNTTTAVVRTEPKGFFQQRWEDGQFKTGLKPGTPLYPYRVQELLKADLIIIVEGEKDVDNVLRLLKGPQEAATTNPMGAGKWRPEFNQYP